MTSAVFTLQREFTTAYGREPSGIWAAPGRVNLIGEHTDYNDGFVLPFALPQRVLVAASTREDNRWEVRSLNRDGSRPHQFGLDDLVPGMEGWSAYVAGVVWALLRAGQQITGADLVLSSDVPTGAGLSSSAALECAVLAALIDLNDLDIEPMARAKLARRAENDFVGAPTGLMDQAASTLCTLGHALFLDCRTLETDQVSFDLAAAGLELLVLDTKTPHTLVDSEYAARRASCEQASRELGVSALRDVHDLDGALSRLADPIVRRRVKHVVTENARVLEAVEVLRSGKVSALAPLMDASHASMRDDFEITVPPVDLAVDVARSCGALGARMTGGGFGGCIIALLGAGESRRIARHIRTAFIEAGYGPPERFVVQPASGAIRIKM